MRLILHLVAAKDSAASDASSAEISDAPADADGNVAEDLKKDELSVMPDTAQGGKPSIFFDKDGKEVKHRIFSVPHFGNTFPDQQDVQILAANQAWRETGAEPSGGGAQQGQAGVCGQQSFLLCGQAEQQHSLPGASCLGVATGYR